MNTPFLPKGHRQRRGSGFQKHWRSHPCRITCIHPDISMEAKESGFYSQQDESSLCTLLCFLPRPHYSRIERTLSRFHPSWLNSKSSIWVWFQVRSYMHYSRTPLMEESGEFLEKTARSFGFTRIALASQNRYAYSWNRQISIVPTSRRVTGINAS